MNMSNLNLVPLRHASLCLDCETITTGHTNCLACGSRALLNVARTLNRPRHSDGLRPERSAVVQMSPPQMRQRNMLYRGAPNGDRSRGQESALPRRFDFSMSENSA